MDECEECQRLWNECQAATTPAVQLDVEVRATTEDQCPQKFEARARAKAAEQERVKARRGWQNIRHQPGIGKSARFIGPAKVAHLRSVFACVPSRLPNGGAFALIPLFGSAAPIDLRPRPDLGFAQSLNSLNAPLNPVPLTAQHR
jgi:hypothetical protein